MIDADTVKHLELIQAVVNRMAQVSFILKGWAVTLVLGLLAVVTNTGEWWYGLLGMVPACIFWVLDGYYLRQERLFRRLYDRVRLGAPGSSISPFSMDTSVVDAEVEPWWKTMLSCTLIATYVTLLAVATGAAICARTLDC